MTRRERLRRTVILCLHFLRNLAFFEASEATQRWNERTQFWITTRNNFLDIAILEWCKLFGDPKAKHHWQKTIVDQDRFLCGLFERLRLSEESFIEYIQEVRTYRDKFVAHLDEENRMDIPKLAPARESAQYLFAWLLEKENDCDAFPDAPQSCVEFYDSFYTEGREAYAKYIDP